jgi:hypothetical protein
MLPKVIWIWRVVGMKMDAGHGARRHASTATLGACWLTLSIAWTVFLGFALSKAIEWLL